jgi:hypothetical protein
LRRRSWSEESEAGGRTLLRRVGLFSGEMVSWLLLERAWGEEAVRFLVGERSGRWRRERGATWGGCGTFWSLVDCWLKRLTRSLIDRWDVAVDRDRGVSRRGPVVAAATGLEAARVVSDEGGSMVVCFSVLDRGGNGGSCYSGAGCIAFCSADAHGRFAAQVACADVCVVVVGGC